MVRQSDSKEFAGTRAHRRAVGALAVAAAVAAAAPGVSAQNAVVVFPFPEQHVAPIAIDFFGFVGSTGQFGIDELDGARIVATRLFMEFEPTGGMDARDFESRFGIPITPDPGASSFFGFTGADFGWSGTAGRFVASLDTTAHNGVIHTPQFFGWEIIGRNGAFFEGQCFNNSRIEFEVQLPRPTCPCETGGDSAVVNIDDLLAYLTLWFALDPAAERTGDSPASIDLFDLLAFLSCWFEAIDGTC